MMANSRSKPLWFRSLFALAAAILFVLMLYPYGDRYYPEGNWLRGPLWLAKAPAGSRDNTYGIAACLILLPLMFSFLVRKNAATIALSLIGAILWIAIGAYLAMLAVV